MSKQFDLELDTLRRKLLTMGAMAEAMTRGTTAMLIKHDMALFEPVRQAEENMDALQKEIDEDIVRLISVYTPVAADLRNLLMATRITAQLERIADKTVDVGHFAQALLKEPPLKPLVDIPRMAEIGGAMLKEVLDAYTEGSVEKAMEVIKMDDEVDKLNDRLFEELMAYAREDVKAIDRVFELILIARCFERIGDHAVNIAEDVVYMVRGQDIRHLKGEG